MAENYGCEHCEKTFTNRRHYELHVNGHLRNSCHVCGLPCNSRKTLAAHMSTAHGSKLEPIVLECKYCMKTFVQKRSLHLHYKTVHKDTGTICLDCGQPFDNEQQLSHHVKTVKHGDGFVCHKCGEVFTRNQQYKLHLQKHDTYSCFNCNAQYANSKKLNKHLKQCVSSTPPIDHYSKNKQATNSGTIYECVECKKTFEKKKYYKRHIKTVIHSANKVDSQFYCAHCPKIFYYKFNLSSHMKQIHFKQYNNYVCNLCGKSFQYRNNYKRHKDSHMQVRNYVCEHCGACFYRKHALQDHQIAIHSEEKNFVCNECGDNFKLKSILTRHMKNHSETKKYVCHCKRVFKFASNLRRHQVNFHNQVYSESIKIKRFIEDNSRSSPLAVMNEEKKKLKQQNTGHISLEDTVTYSMMAYSDNLDLSSADIAESVLQVASASSYKIECEENSCFPGIHPPIETSLVCSLNDGVDLSPNSSQQYLSDYVVPHQFPFLNI